MEILRPGRLDGSKLLFLARTGGDSVPLEILTVGADGSGFTRIH